MSKRQGLIASAIGVIGGAIAGSPFLNDTQQCVDNYGTVPQCALNEAIGPFISAIAVGVCVAMLIGHLIYLAVHRILDPAPRSKPAQRAANDLEDPYLQIASWNMSPRVQKGIDSTRGQMDARVEERRSATERRAVEPILAEDPRVRPPSKVGSIGSRERPMPAPRRLA